LKLASSFISEGEPTALQAYNNDYFGFAVIGLSIAVFVQAIAGIFSGALRSAQVSGTLEVLIASQTSLPAFLVYSAAYGFIYAGIKLSVALLIAAFLFQVDFHTEEALIVVSILVLTIATFAGAGILAASFVVWFKQSEPFTAAFMTISFLLCGVIYPTSVLPGWLEKIADLLPLTHAISGLRGALLQGAGIASLWGDLSVLIAYAGLLPLSFFVFEFAVRQCKASGSLGHH
jgi:ABC-2 type transport system permease protein